MMSLCVYLPHYYVDASGYYDYFTDLPNLPLIPYEFRCNGDESSLLDCTKYTLSCYYYYYYHIYHSVTCQGQLIQTIMISNNLLL